MSTHVVLNQFLAYRSRFLQQMFPVEGDGDNEPVLSGDKPTAAVDPKRPAFSLPLMTQNFRRFNARQVLF